MGKPFHLFCLGVLLASGVVSSVGCSEAEAPESRADTADQAGAYQDSVESYERSVGTSHGLTPAQIHSMVEALNASPEFQNKFMGVQTVQKPSDAWIIMEILHEVKPDLIVETGTYHGGSAVLWAVILEHINPDGQVITIDIKDQRETAAVEIPIAQERVEFLLGSSTDPKVVAKVERRAEGKRVLVLLDSLHSKEHVAAELEAYAPLVGVGSYVIVQDTLVGPIRAIDEFLAANDSFVADRSRERYPDTNSVRGYLRRVD